ncbi:uncharacterized protein EI97DRAFT_379292 [Westerdykella ornata]|uniref:AB hydrolase-1 domain-containing protein n=1 Tax=Westerdykella ornata TaxID=318751 RepID=A0A6A6JKW1_WESOR|nr:uncharacterized protein EI97DRAFT_379292 [Westerdykella ornata]KAF2275529.1 hypothetical protein EI97DRAFT_379292 [Westerdykella ornata]
MAFSQDPRSSSAHSLTPGPDGECGRRRILLLVYIHGFMGNETSFKSFPAHLHNLLAITLAESHVVHTKIYPRYQSRYSLRVARDQFSKWLTPNETSWTDVILLGHSMGGLVAADIALLFKHNILGVVNFDVPFLGMHPGIVKAGLGSIFNSPTPEDSTPDAAVGNRPSRTDTLFNPKPADPNYDPRFPNDVHLPVRKGWESALHFFNKHADDLISAGKVLVKSHAQFGGAMADYRKLKDRYARIRALEEDDEAVRRSANPEVQHPPRIRFVNYYTASTGRVKKPKSPKTPSGSRPTSRNSEGPAQSIASFASGSQVALTHASSQSTGMISPRISVDEYRNNEVIPVSPQEAPLGVGLSENAAEDTGSGPNLPPVPEMPQEPPFVDPTRYPGKAERKAAEKEYAEALKDYKRAVKARNAVLDERAKLEQEWAKQRPGSLPDSLRSTPERQSLYVPEPTDSSSEQTGSIDENMQSMQLASPTPSLTTTSSSPYTNYVFSRSTILAQPPPEDRSPVTTPNAVSGNSSYTDSTTTLPIPDPNSTVVQDSTPPPTPKPRRYKKFCMLPPKDAYGNKDPTWVPVVMENMDEVVAHTSLFVVSETYERLVGDVGARIEEWVRENESVRVVREMEGLG